MPDSRGLSGIVGREKGSRMRDRSKRSANTQGVAGAAIGAMQGSLARTA